ncbi:sugar phosphate isomerase/epimerase family protein [Bacillus velezensis]|uniref:sugar phosphate isomerase/epimerase family protein n=1 Tax=Bacillus velezensis TaxID=492670 RepID=UPI0035C0476E
MSIQIAGAPCCWGVDDPKNPYLPPWERVLNEASQAGCQGIELGPYGYIPFDIQKVTKVLTELDLTIIAGTIFDNLVDQENIENLIKQVDDICSFITKLPAAPALKHHQYQAPYLVVIDWGHEERNKHAGRPEEAPRLSEQKWKQMIQHIKKIAEHAWNNYGVRAVIHPHAGGYIEFEDEINRLLHEIPHETAGLCLDTGHLYYSKMDPIEWIERCADRLDYLHFKDIHLDTYHQVMKERTRFFEACAKGVMCPIGQGVIDYHKIRHLLTELNYSGYVTFEQERDPRDADTSLEDVKQSVDFLNKLGFTNELKARNR